MIFFQKHMLITGTLLSLAACGGGGTEGPIVEALDSAAELESDIIGIAIRGNSSLVATSGTLNHDNGQATIRSGDAVISGENGLNGRGDLQGQNEFLSVDVQDNIPGEYNYVTLFRQSDATDSYLGVAGIATPAALIAEISSTNATATYRGSAIASVAIDENLFEFTDGQSTVNVDFGSGSVNAHLDDFSIRNQTPNSNAQAPFDRIELNGMTIDGNSFSGGNLQISNDGNPYVLPSDFEQGFDSAGNFYGVVDGNGHPVEVGGGFVAQGDEGHITGLFLAQ